MDKNNSGADNAELALDDERRVKTLSPSALVIRRFLRNRLAIAGLVIIVAMFLFAFAGPFFSPYSEYQVFTSYEKTEKEYANVLSARELRIYPAEGKSFSGAAKSAFLSAVRNGEDSFEADGVKYYLEETAPEVYLISADFVAAVYDAVGGTIKSDSVTDEELLVLLKSAAREGLSSVIHEGSEYIITEKGKKLEITVRTELALSSYYVLGAYAEETEFGFRFRADAYTAAAAELSGFESGGREYVISSGGGRFTVSSGGAPYADISEAAVQAAENGVFLSASFGAAAEAAINSGEKSFSFDGTDYSVSGVNGVYKIKAPAEAQLISIYGAPDGAHWLGTDQNGMDILTRLMYGGRISLMIGFIVVFIEVALGVLLGGAAGFFGGWADNLIMRAVDVFNCIPTLPLFIIIGAVMDAQKIDPQLRIFMLMIILGAFSWPGIARLVRGQILSLREQEFMVAAEATGISVGRRIFRHLIPNVVPQLIVMATMGLGSIILMESTLSFFGLGVKFPFASWGNIINAVTNIRVMTSYWFVWIPAGMLILLTVLGFNFVGDGLRDAFDPKMKR